MRRHESEGAMGWVPTWAQAVSDFRGEDEEPPFDDVTVRMTVPASIGGGHLRVELSNRFGDDPVRIGRGAVGVGGRFVEIAFDGRSSTEIAAGESSWTDPIDLAVDHGEDVVVDLYLPDPTPYATAGGFRFDRSTAGDFAGSREFPAANTVPAVEVDGNDWSLPAGGPFLRTIEVAGVAPRAVIVALGASSTAMGWPQYTAALLPADARIAVVNRGIPGNRVRLGAPRGTPSWGRAGLARFDEDVLGTIAVTHVVIAYNTNDWGLPGKVTPLDEMPALEQLIEAYEELLDRGREAGLGVILTTVTPLAPELLVDSDPDREGIRQALNDWIRTGGNQFVDFDAAIRSGADPSRLAEIYAAPDHTHPGIAGQKRLAQTMVEALARIQP